MKHLVLCAVLLGAFLNDAAANYAMELQFPSGWRIAPDSLFVRTRIDQYVAVTEVIEVFDLSEIPIPAAGFEVLLTGSMDTRVTVISVSVERNGVWHSGVVQDRAHLVGTEFEDRVESELARHNGTPVFAPIRISVDGSRTVRTLVTYTEVLSAVSSSMIYRVPYGVRRHFEWKTPDRWDLEVRSREPLQSVSSSFGWIGTVAADHRSGHLSVHGAQSFDLLKPPTLQIQYAEPLTGSALTIGWHEQEAYGVLPAQFAGLDMVTTSQRPRIWVVIDDRFWGHEPYNTFKQLCLEVIEQLQHGDDFDVFLYESEDRYHSWRDRVGPHVYDPRVAGAWMMQSNGFSNGVGPDPAMWVSGQSFVDVWNRDVIFLTYSTGTRPASVYPGSAQYLNSLNVRFHTIGLADPDAMGAPFFEAASITGGTCTITPRIEDTKATVQRLMATIRGSVSTIAYAQSRSLACNVPTLIPTGVLDSASPGAVAMVISRWEPGSVSVAGTLQNVPWTWSLSIDPLACERHSSMVPMIWAHGVISHLYEIARDLNGTLSVAMEIHQEIVRLSCAYGIASRQTVFMVEEVL